MPIFQVLIQYLTGLLTFRLPLKCSCMDALDLETKTESHKQIEKPKKYERKAHASLVIT